MHSNGHSDGHGNGNGNSTGNVPSGRKKYKLEEEGRIAERRRREGRLERVLGGMRREGYTLHPTLAPPSHSSRLFLSLKSTLPQETSYALSHLLSHSSRGELRLSLFPGSVEALLDVVEGWVGVVEKETADGNGAGFGSGQGWRTKEEDDLSTRGISALLVLRNTLFFGDPQIIASNRGILLGVNMRPTMDQVEDLQGQALPPRILDLICRAFTGRGIEVDGFGVGELNPLGSDGVGAGVKRLLELSVDEPEPVVYLLEVLVGIVPDLVGLLDTPDPLLGDDVDEIAGEGDGEDEDEKEVLVTKVHTAEVLRQILLDVLPECLRQTGDLGMITPLLQLLSLVPAPYLPLPTLFPRLISFLLLTPSAGSSLLDLTQRPLHGRTPTGEIFEFYPPGTEDDSPYPPELLRYTLNLLYHLTQDMPSGLTLLKGREVKSWLKVLVRFLKWGVKGRRVEVEGVGAGLKAREDVLFEPGLEVIPDKDRGGRAEDGGVVGNEMHKGKGGLGGGDLKHAGLGRDDGSEGVGEEVGLGPVLPIDKKRRNEIRAMEEPMRTRAWMQELFLKDPDSSITQVAFWKAYQEYNGGVLPDEEKPIPPMFAAQPTIKNATDFWGSVVPMVVTVDREGRKLPSNVFVLQGMRFKRSVGRRHTYACKWSGCSNPHGSLTANDLINHLRTIHSPSVDQDSAPPCRWLHCRGQQATHLHLFTHIPPPPDPLRLPGGNKVWSHPDSSSDVTRSRFLTFREPPPLAEGYKVHYDIIDHPQDPDGHLSAESDALRAALIMRNLARALRVDSDHAGEREKVMLEDGGDERARKKRKMDESGAFGLPAPPGLLDADLGGFGAGRGSMEGYYLSGEERRRAKEAFGLVVEEAVLDSCHLGSEITEKLVECVGL